MGTGPPLAVSVGWGFLPPSGMRLFSLSLRESPGFIFFLFFLHLFAAVSLFSAMISSLVSLPFFSFFSASMFKAEGKRGCFFFSVFLALIEGISSCARVFFFFLTSQGVFRDREARPFSS